ncbi:MAG: tetratricopeptide repeat protein [Deinococcales bacterium]
MVIWEIPIEILVISEAKSYYEQALAISREVKDTKRGEYLAWQQGSPTGYCLGQNEEAIDCYERALTISHKIKSRQGKVITLAI